MKTSKIQFLIVFGLVVLFSIKTLKIKAKSYNPENLFYMVGFLDSYQSFVQHADEISIICPDVCQIDSADQQVSFTHWETGGIFNWLL